jgi:serine/threonine protein kinase
VATEESFTRDKLVRKPIIVKREKGNRRNRVEHEKNILKQIKGGRAVFFPQYYLSTVENELKEDLLSDFLWQELTLDKLAIFRRNSLSLGTKCFILLMLLQGVRYLSMFGIVHLDLKPGNLMVSNSLNVKIIDFGESYHPAICDNVTPAYAPGFSPPYGSPEVFCPPPDNRYTEKSDVFSIGVIAHEFMFGKVPFTFNHGMQKRIFAER